MDNHPHISSSVHTWPACAYSLAYPFIDHVLAAQLLYTLSALTPPPFRWLPPQLQEFDRQSQAKLSEMSAADVSLLMEAFKTYGYAPSKDWLQQFAGG